jgi:UDP-2-acetamido-2,6-beta-L-arabino-hexul-4-ose reductase
MRHIERSEVVEYRVRGEAFQVIDIPPGYTHSIQNIGAGDMVTLFWASEIFDPDRPDTYFTPVLMPTEIQIPATA